MDVMQKSQRPHIIAEHQRYKNKQNKQKKKKLKYNTNP